MKKKPVVYISGPISDMPNENRFSFEKAAILIDAVGLNYINPHDLHPAEPKLTWKQYMVGDIKSLVDCDAILLLPGWEKSRGANIEKRLAEDLGITLLKSFAELTELAAYVRA